VNLVSYYCSARGSPKSRTGSGFEAAGSHRAQPANLGAVAAAGGLGAAAYAFNCTSDTIPFIAVCYGAAIALCAFIGATSTLFPVGEIPGSIQSIEIV
jgi:hypothetical protein